MISDLKQPNFIGHIHIASIKLDNAEVNQESIEARFNRGNYFLLV